MNQSSSAADQPRSPAAGLPAPSAPDVPAGISRRAALGRVAAGAAAAVAFPTIVPGRALGLDGAPPPSEQITLGVIGIGPRCTYVLTSMLGLGDVRCLAIADVQASRRDKGKALVDGHYGTTDCVLYRDLRDLLARRDIDAVLIATGDRWHTPATVLAAEAGKDIYCEKPCGLTINNCREIDDAIARNSRIFQAGTQRRSVPLVQYAVKLAHEGALGKLQTLHASVYEPTFGNQWLPGQPAPPPEECDWNLWLGPAPWRPYNSDYVNGKWRGQFDFESGARLLDWGVHTLDLCQWANSADDTVPVEYEPVEKGIACRYADGVTILLDFLANPFGDRSPTYTTKLGLCPVRFEGSAGSVEVGDDGIEVKPEGLRADVPERAKRIRGIDASLHARNFFDCVRSREQPICNPKIMRHSHVACHAAALSWILGRKLVIDPATETFVNDPEANSLRTRPVRNWRATA
jgi:predicted dehydrogenase